MMSKEVDFTKGLELL